MADKTLADRLKDSLVMARELRGAVRAIPVACAGGEGHGIAVALLSSACIHEHVRADVPCCRECVDHFAPPASNCCQTCEYLPDDEAHCCPLIVTSRELA